MNVAKKQHYVPRLYLKNFTYKKNQLFVYDKEVDSIYSASIKDVSCERFFYDDPEQNINGQVLEKWFHDNFEQTIEPVYDKLLKSLEDSSFIELSKDIKLLLSHFFAVQVTRTKDFREQLVKMQGSFFDELRKRGFSFDKIKELVPDAEPRELHAMHILDFKMFEELSQIFLNHMWIVIDNQNLISFYSSDNPIVKHNSRFHNKYISYEGFNSPGIEVSFPLNPRFLITMIDRNEYRALSKYENKILKVHHKDSLDLYNQLQATSFGRQLYSVSQNFETAFDILSKNPHLKESYAPKFRFD